jgi:hypothetical protein
MVDAISFSLTLLTTGKQNQIARWASLQVQPNRLKAYYLLVNNILLSKERSK